MLEGIILSRRAARASWPKVMAARFAAQAARLAVRSGRSGRVAARMGAAAVLLSLLAAAPVAAAPVAAAPAAAAPVGADVVRDGEAHQSRTRSAATAESRQSRTLLVLGDSLSAAYGMAREQGWVHLLGQRVAQQARGWRVVNASMSGETTAGGASRIAAELTTHDPDLVVLELGANDALRGLPLDAARSNLQRMIDAAQAHGAPVLLLGMRIPPNYGRAYADAFHGMYRELAEQEGVSLLPFLLEPIALDRDAFLPDDVHPRPDVQDELMEHVWPTLAPLLEPGAAP